MFAAITQVSEGLLKIHLFRKDLKCYNASILHGDFTSPTLPLKRVYYQRIHGEYVKRSTATFHKSSNAHPSPTCL